MKEVNYVRCDKCDKIISKKHLKEHVKNVHVKIKNHFCEQCPKMFATKNSLNQHMLSHKEEKDFKCQVCDKMFKMKAALNVHSNIHTKERKYCCDDCGKSFTDPSYFGRHKKEQHSEINAFECKVCPKTFRTHLRLKKHLKTHNPNQEEAQNQKEKTPKGAKKYDETFILKMLQRIDEIGINRASKESGVVRVKLEGWKNKKEEKFKCNICGSCHEFQYRLQTHVYRAHTKIRKNFKYTFNDSFRADVVKFVQENSITAAELKYNVSDSAIRNWIRIMEEPFKCLICGTVYGYEKKIKNHMRIKHRITDILQQENNYKQEKAIAMESSNMVTEGTNDVSNIDKDDKRVDNADGMQRQYQRECNKDFIRDINSVNEMLKNNEAGVEEIQTKEEEDDMNGKQIKLEKVEFSDSMPRMDIPEEASNGTLNEVQNELGDVKQYPSDERKMFEVERNDEDRLCNKTEEERSVNKREIQDHEKEVTKEKKIFDEYQNNESKFKTEKIPLSEENIQILLNDQNLKNEDVKEELVCEESMQQKKVEHEPKRGKTGRLLKRNRSMSKTCEQCGKMFSDSHKLRTHIYSHTKERPYKCGICQETFRLTSHLNRHKLTHKDKNIKCHHCSKLFGDQKLLNLHLKNSTNQNVKCQVCNKPFKRRENLKVHSRIHTGEMPFSCEYCEQSFRRQGKLKEHLESIHDCSPSEIFMCDICGKHFKRNLSLKEHHKTHAEAQFKCSACEKRFYSNKSYLKHINVHEQTYKCDHCGKCFETNGKLERHKQIHTGVKAFQCEICTKGYRDNRSLLQHMEIKHAVVTGKKTSFSCSQCDRSYTRAEFRDRHALKHVENSK